MTPARVLLIEDESTMRQSLEIILSDSDYNVTSAADGDSGMETLKKESFELLITDWRLKGAGGEEILAAAAEADPLMPVIVITGYASMQGMQEAIDRGAYDYLIKPFEVEQLKLLARRALQYRQLVIENRQLKERIKTLEEKTATTE